MRTMSSMVVVVMGRVGGTESLQVPINVRMDYIEEYRW